MGFSFGKNWQSFAQTMSYERLDYAKQGITRLIPQKELVGKFVCDVGSGSGLHAMAFLSLGVERVDCFDKDQVSVETSRKLLANSTYKSWKVFQADVLQDLPSLQYKYDIVYSWGVLHHTGNLVRAVENASKFCANQGLFVVALYRRTLLCQFWKIEKSIYSKLPRVMRTMFDLSYAFALLLALTIRGRNPYRYVISYREKRGMRFLVDVRDWLGGYPYESIRMKALLEIVIPLGFQLEKSFVSKQRVGIFGSGCNEYVFRRVTT